MVREVTPKKLQREKKFAEALEGFLQSYVTSLEKGDLFMSALYMDEIVQTVILSNPDQPMNEEGLRDCLLRFRYRIPESAIRDYEDDIEIALRKRFPEKFGLQKADR